MEFEGWINTTWGEVSELKYGKALKNYKKNTEGIPVYGTNGQIGYTAKPLTSGPGIIVGRKGAYRGVHYSNSDFYVIDTAYFLEVNKDIVDIRWAYYELVSKDINSLDSGSAIPSTKREDFYALKVSIPPLFIQRKIVEVLDTLDAKIVLNSQIILNLERLAQTLFKRWFGDFEFPNENGELYKSSGGEMVESELGMIPKEWIVSELKEIAKHSKTSFNPKKVEPLNVAHFSLPAFDQREYPITESSETIKSSKYYINENSLLFSKMNPSTPRVWLPNINSDISNVCSTEFVVLDTSYKKNKSFVYSLIKSNEFTIYLINNATGSTNSRQRVSPTTAIAYKFPYNEEIVNKYERFITPLLDKILVLREENQNLISLRDTLLPKLLFGEIELPNETEVTENVPIS